MEIGPSVVTKDIHGCLSMVLDLFLKVLLRNRRTSVNVGSLTYGALQREV